MTWQFDDPNNLPPGYSFSNGRARVESWKQARLAKLTKKEGQRYLELWDRFMPEASGGKGGGLTPDELIEFRYLERKGGI